MLNQEMKTAAAIALELSKASPSGRIAWKKFRELMEVEGYEVTTDKAYQEQVRYYMKKTTGSPLEA
ncbi:hypothetical protein, partial [Klebsiella pneumoniae]